MLVEKIERQTRVRKTFIPRTRVAMKFMKFLCALELVAFPKQIFSIKNKKCFQQVTKQFYGPKTARMP